ncbi:HYC_CC_PP family protein [Aquimarina algicola]|uniref:Secreted protein n=1 Tax=Aquimarina algicola TaxID=2589995 RepID=A0A504IYA3_9FLAO|nr:hypothetical protein [Aquimarina algicola]TPN83467.1 hypothetical protein FHK87_19815 [Aquimarina algicola]
MLEKVRKIGSLLLALMVLTSTMSFTVNMHYCGDTLVDTVLFKEAKRCGMEVQKPNPSSNACKITQKSCCSDQTLIIEGQNELKVTFHDLSFEQQLFISSYIYSYINLFEGLEQNIIPFQDYPPPLLTRDILILDQTFLI